MDNSLSNDDTVDTIYLSFDSTLSSNAAMNVADEISMTEEDTHILEKKYDSYLSNKMRKAVTSKSKSLLYVDEDVYNLKELNEQLCQCPSNIIKPFQLISSAPSNDQHSMVGFKPETSIRSGPEIEFLEAEYQSTAPSIDANSTDNKEIILIEDSETDESAITSGVYSLSSDIEYTQLRTKKLPTFKHRVNRISTKKLNFNGLAGQRVISCQSKFSGMVDVPIISDDDSTDLPDFLKQIMHIGGGVKSPTGDAITHQPKKRMGILNNRGHTPRLPMPEIKKRADNPAKHLVDKEKTTLNAAARINQNITHSRKIMLPLTKAKPIPDLMSVLANDTESKVVTEKTLISEIAETNLKNVEGHLVQKSRPKLVKPDITYSCNICSSTFRIKSLLDAHKRLHEETTVIERRSAGGGGSGAVRNLNLNKNQCKYCDKKFMLERTLHIHLMQNCSKIPPSEKRKLEFTELNHVEKPQLPAFGLKNSYIEPVNPFIPNAIKPKDKPVKKPASSSSNATQSTDESSSASEEIKSKKQQFGKSRTANKSVPCRICKRTFLNITDYTNHVIKMHPTHQFRNTKRYSDESSTDTDDKSS